MPKLTISLTLVTQDLMAAPLYHDFTDAEKDLNNRIFVEGIPEDYTGTILYLDGQEGQTTTAVLAAGFEPSQCMAPDFDEATYLRHLKNDVKSIHGTFFECLVKMGPEMISQTSHVYMDIMSVLHGSGHKLTRYDADGKRIKIPCYPLRNILHYLRFAPDKVHLSLTLCSSRRPVGEWKKGATRTHYFTIYEKSLLDLFDACGFEVVKANENNRHYRRSKRGAHPMTFFDFHLKRIRPFDFDAFEAAIPGLFSEKHCMKKISLRRWFDEYKLDYKSDSNTFRLTISVLLQCSGNSPECIIYLLHRMNYQMMAVLVL